MNFRSCIPDEGYRTSIESIIYGQQGERCMNKTDKGNSSQDVSKNVAIEGYFSLMSKIVQKIRAEPFLFIIAISALLIGYASIKIDMGPSIVRLIILIIAGLGVIGILGYYILASFREWKSAKMVVNNKLSAAADPANEKLPSSAYRLRRKENNDASKVYDILNNNFDNVEFDAFCSKYFQEVKNKFSEGMRKDAKIIILVDDCVRHRNMPKLLSALERETNKKLK
jgi:hypothetical protein